MTGSEWEDWIRRWWRPQWDIRSAAEPSCRLCGDDTDLMLIRRTAPDKPLIYDDVIPLCGRCCHQVETLVAEQTAPGAPWEMMPRYLAVDIIIGDIGAGRIRLDPPPGD